MRLVPAAPLALVLLATAALTPPPVEPAPDPWEEACRLGYTVEDGQRVNLYCAVAIQIDSRPPRDGTRWPDPEKGPQSPYFPSPATPLPFDLRVDGAADCAAGPVGTTKPVTLSAAFTVMTGPPPSYVEFEFQADDESEPTGSGGSLEADGRAVQEFALGELAPGRTYKWRVRGDTENDLSLWSRWCEFTVAADAPDLRDLDPTEVDAIVEVGLRPERGYPVRLAQADWRKVREPFDLAYDGSVDDGDSSQRFDELAAAVRPDASGRLTLTGAQWATVMLQLAGWTEIVAFGNDEVEPEFQTDPAAYWKVVDRISAQLGGPRHPKLGLR